MSLATATLFGRPRPAVGPCDNDLISTGACPWSNGRADPTRSRGGGGGEEASGSELASDLLSSSSAIDFLGVHVGPTSSNFRSLRRACSKHMPLLP